MQPAASVPIKKDTKPRDKEGDKKSEVVRYPRLRRARAGVMLKAVLAGAGEWWQQPGHQVARGYTSPSRDSSSSRTTSRVL